MALNDGFTGEVAMTLGGSKSGKMTRRYAAVTDQTFPGDTEAISGFELLSTQRRGGNRRWQPRRKSASLQSWLQPSQG
jgi:hypothetical protein